MSKKSITLIILLIFGGSSLFACKCSTFSFDDQMERATSIFIGSYIGTDENEMTFQLIKLYKGKMSTIDKIKIFQSNSSCYKIPSFATGEHLLIFADEQGIHNCSRTNKILYNLDFGAIEKLNLNSKIYDQDAYSQIKNQKIKAQDLLRNCGNDDLPTLNSFEIEFLIPYLNLEKSKEELQSKNILFVTGSGGGRITDKANYFKSIKSYHSNGRRISNNIVWLDDEMKVSSGGYDAIITYWVKVFSNRQLKKIVRTAKRQKSLPVTIDKK
jgi:hypothetical protein